MLTTKQFTTLIIMAILSGAFSSFLVIGIFSHDFSFAAISFLLLIFTFIVGVFVAVPVPAKKDESISIIDMPEAPTRGDQFLYGFKAIEEYSMLTNDVIKSIDRANRICDIKIEGEINPEFDDK